jgi:branched-chain amino acid transport system substrate-binding protein
VTASVLAGCGTRLEREQILAGGTVSNGAGNSAAGGSAGSDGTGAVGGEIAPDGSVVDPATGAVTGSTSATAGGGGAAAGGGSAATGGGSAATGGGSAGTGAGAASTGGGRAGAAAGAATGKSAAVFGGSSCSPAAGSPITIGNVSTLSGVLGQLFSPVVPALQTFVKAQNACGGLNGHPVRLVIGDDQGDPSTAVSVAQRQIQNDKVLAFMGNIQVLTVDAMVSVVNRAKVPMIGGDITNNTWFTNELLFPQGPPPQAIAYGFVQAGVEKYGKKKLGSIYCAEVPQACSQINRAYKELAPQFGAQVVTDVRVSITAPSYTSQCIEAQRSGAEVMALIVDAPTQVRYANSCDGANFNPQYLAYPLGVGNEKQFLGKKSLANTYVPLNAFAWMANETPAEKFYQRSVAKYNPGFTSGNAASLGWVSGALAVAASSKLTDKPTSQQLIDGLHEIKKNDLGGLTAPLSFFKGGTPKIPYCLFGVTSNADNSGWQKPLSKAICTSVTAPSDPQK